MGVGLDYLNKVIRFLELLNFYTGCVGKVNFNYYKVIVSCGDVVFIINFDKLNEEKFRDMISKLNVENNTIYTVSDRGVSISKIDGDNVELFVDKKFERFVTNNLFELGIDDVNSDYDVSYPFGVRVYGNWKINKFKYFNFYVETYDDLNFFKKLFTEFDIKNLSYIFKRVGSSRFSNFILVNNYELVFNNNGELVYVGSIKRGRNWFNVDDFSVYYKGKSVIVSDSVNFIKRILRSFDVRKFSVVSSDYYSYVVSGRSDDIYMGVYGFKVDGGVVCIDSRNENLQTNFMVWKYFNKKVKSIEF